MGIAGDLAGVRQHHVACLPVTAVAQVQHHVLGERRDSVFLGRQSDQLEHGGDVGVREAVGDPDVGHLLAPLPVDAVAWPRGAASRPPARFRSEFAAPAAARRPSGLAGTNLYPTLRTVPIRDSFSVPSLARSRRT
jgi:hypothetical protein